MAKLKGHPLARALPGLGWTHFDGKRFRNDHAMVAFKFDDWQERNRFVERLKTVPGVRARVCSFAVGWFDEYTANW